MEETLTNCNGRNVKMTERLLKSGDEGSVFNKLSYIQGNSERLFFFLFFFFNFQIYSVHLSSVASFVKKA